MKQDKDPLHIPSERLVVYFNNKPVYMINKHLLDQQNCWSNLEEIKETHWLKLLFYEMINETDDWVKLRDLALDIQECEFELQRLWGFDMNEKFHRFWLTPKCSCPKLDCEDAYPTGFYTINSDCLLHGI